MHDIERAMVTGGAGFVGTALCQRLLDDGAQVICIDDLSTAAPAQADTPRGRPGYRFIRHDISRPLHGARIDVDTVFHLASPASPVDYLRLPVQTMRAGAFGTANVLDIAERCGARMVLASTSEVYGDPQQHPQSETYWGNVNPIGPRSVYDEAKRFAEALTFAYRRARSADVAVARIFNTYGPRMRADDGRMVPTFCAQALAGQPITVTGSGQQTRSLCYVDDTVDALIRLARSDCAGPVNVGNPAELTVVEVAELIRELAGSESEIEFLPAPEDDPQRRCPDIEVAHTQLGWRPKVDHREGLKVTVGWFSSERNSTITKDSALQRQ